MDGVDRARPPVGGEALQVRLDALDRVGVEEIAEFGLPEEVGKERSVKREGGGPALGDGSVVVVHERSNEIERE